MSRRDEVLEAALELLDEVGLDALTTRRLADRLGVQPGALYRHYPSKAALLDAMAAQVAVGAAGGSADEGEVDASQSGGVAAAESAGDWAGRLQHIAMQLRGAMLSRRDGARLLATFRKPSPVAEQVYFQFIEMLIAAGLAPAQAATGIDTLFAFVNGFTIEEQARDPRPRDERDHQFAAGVTLIITGIRASLTR